MCGKFSSSLSSIVVLSYESVDEKKKKEKKISGLDHRALLLCVHRTLTQKTRVTLRRPPRRYDDDDDDDECDDDAG